MPATTSADRRNARLYLIGLAASLVGDSAMSLVAGIWVKSLTGSSAAAGLVSVCIYAPSLLGPAAGVLVDRVHRQRWLLWVNLAAAALVASLIIVSGRAQVWVIYVVMAGYGLVVILIDPAEDALFAQMLPLELRRRVNGWRLGIQETGRLVAPLIGTGLFVLLGGGAVAALDAGTFIVAAVIVSRLRVADAPRARPGRWHADIAAGLLHLRRTPALWTVVLAAALVMAVSGVGVAAQYSLVSALGERPGFLGFLTAALGLGSIAASMLSPWLLTRLGEPKLAIFGLVNFVLGTLLRASGWMPAAVAGSLILGFALPWVFLAAINMTQRLTPNALQGRVSATVTFALFAPQAPTQAAGALAIAYLSYREIYIGSAIGVAVITVWLWFRARTDR
jgi:Na+/melibiose symporter-like transporter